MTFFGEKVNMKLTPQDFANIIFNIEFLFIQPYDQIDQGIGTGKNISFLGKSLTYDEANIRFKNRDKEIKSNLSFLRKIPKMSTIAIGYLINEITKFLEPDECYLNIGCWRGYSFFAGVLNHNCFSIGIDNFSEFGGPKAEFLKDYEQVKHPKSSFFDLDYQEYFESYHNTDTKIGFYFYDGNHSYDHQKESLDVAKPYFSKNVIILVDDTNTNEARSATLEFVKENHPHYEIIFDQLTYINGHPTFWNGLMILRKV
ncbi:MAG: class I SAM-dependent methyltransferase [Okeania sp. SIO3B5]|uniref:class I SAM-dependent methyltransferase n=1 Tax=Okeania sp. SIO3B5 TaxID=2607811 RepID=UPI00140048F8|nr:class I SAM-dependent methyltransferase [Okeania sp. SIO3B5]NEO55487.1 class I SAM-dependent methyltransferase [Okeania sp. SIO3B5]